MSVLLVNPMVAPQVQQAARAFLDAGELHRFITTVRHDDKALWQRIAVRLARAGGFDLDAQLRRRALTEIPAQFVETFGLGELVRLSVAKMDRSRLAADMVWEVAERAFGRAAARRARPPVTAVYSYEYCARPVFAAAKRRGMGVIYETPAAEPRFVFDTIRREIARFPGVETAFDRHEARNEERRIAWRRSEWNAADIVVANSSFTRSTYAGAGLDTGKVRVVPLGCPPPVTPEAAEAGGSDPAGPLRLVWAGKFGILKGAHYLIEAWRAGNLAAHARLDVFGVKALPPALIDPPPGGIHFHGTVPRSVLHGHFAKADALVFPTLSDGWGMVATEAWAQGLPVITTRNAGAADLLRPGDNGLLTVPGDAGALAEALLWCAANRASLRAMRRASQATAAANQWAEYRRALVAAVRPALMRPPAP